MKKTLICGFVLFVIAVSGKAQNHEIMPPANNRDLTKGFYVGGVASTNGWGAEARYLLNKRFSFKTGFETLNFTTNFNFDESDIEYDAAVDYKTGGIFLLADYNFLYHIHLSGGVIFNSFNPDVKGQSISDLAYGDINIPEENIGDFKFTIASDLKVSPYAGLGWRSFIGKNQRVLFNLEGGMYYMGPPKVSIEATGLLAPTADPSHGQKELLEKQFDQYKIYPVVKMNLAVKLF